MNELPDWAKAGQQKWNNNGSQRPEFAEQPGAGQESVWDYPRPPRLDADSRHVVVRCGDHEIARSTRSIRVLETAGAPTFYLPPEDVNSEFLRENPASSRCEWKGTASYRDVVVPGKVIEQAAWCYADPFPDYAAISEYFSFYPGKLDCFVDGETVRPQPGGLYGGWVTDEIVGPIKGEPGSGHW